MQETSQLLITIAKTAALTVISVGILSAIVVFVIIRVRRGQEATRARQRDMRKVAKELGFKFTAYAGGELASQHDDLEFFHGGYNQRMQNQLHGTAEKVVVDVFDFRFVQGAGNAQTTVVQTIFSYDASDLNLPRFKVRRENIFDTVGSVFGFRDLDFASHPEFSRLYLLQGEDEAEIRALFDAELMTFFERQKAICAEASGSRFVLFHEGRQIEREGIRPLLEVGLELLEVLRGRNNREASGLNVGTLE